MFTLTLLATAFAAPGDTCQEPLTLEPDTLVSGSTAGRVRDAIPPCGPSGGGGVWYEFTAPSDGVLSLTTCGGPVAAQIAVYTDGCSTLTCIDGMSNTCPAELEIDVESGDTYQVLVYAEETSGAFDLVNLFEPAAPAVEPPIDCTNRIPAVCQLTNRMVSLVNTEAGSLVLTESSTVPRLRPSNLYTKVERIYTPSAANQCTLLGTMGGLYDLDTESWQGFDFRLGVQAPAGGTFTRAQKVWEGDTGIHAPYAVRFGVYNSAGQVAGSSGPLGSQYVMGSWIRIAGNLGVYANVVGNCGPTDFVDVFEPWYVGTLPASVD